MSLNKMTPREAAAKVREMAESCRQRALSGPPDSARHAAHEREVAYRLAAGVIDQILIPTPQPWPPPEGLRECLAFDKDAQWWIPMSRSPHQDWQEAVRYHVFSHYLPMPEKPEVQG